MQVFFWTTVCAMTLAAIAAIFFALKRHGRAAGIPALLSYVAIAATAVATYTFIGTPEAVGRTQDARHSATSARATERHRNKSRVAPSIRSLVGGLEERLESNPDDAGGWLLLAQSYEQLGRREEAVAALDKARALGKSDASLERKLNDAKPAAVVRGRVSLAPEDAASVNADDVVFVFARHGEEQRMPVAAMRRRAADLPFDFELGDRQAMMQGRRISDFSEVVVTARISRSGKAGDNSLSLEATSDPVTTDGRGRVELVISAGTATGDLAHE